MAIMPFRVSEMSGHQGCRFRWHPRCTPEQKTTLKTHTTALLLLDR